MIVILFVQKLQIVRERESREKKIEERERDEKPER